MTLSFDQAECKGDLDSLPLTLAAIVGTHSDEDEHYGSSTAMLGMLNALNGSANSAHVSTMGGGRANDASASLKSAEVSTDLNELSGPQLHESSKVAFGDVVNITGLKLDVGSTENHDSVLSTKKKNIALDKHTLVVLIPKNLLEVTATSKVPTAPAAKADASPLPVSATSAAEASPPTFTPPPPAPEPVDDVAVCEPPACHPVSLESEAQSIATADLSLAQIGYHPRPHAEIDSLKKRYLPRLSRTSSPHRRLQSAHARSPLRQQQRKRPGPRHPRCVVRAPQHEGDSYHRLAHRRFRSLSVDHQRATASSCTPVLTCVSMMQISTSSREFLSPANSSL